MKKDMYVMSSFQHFHISLEFGFYPIVAGGFKNGHGMGWIVCKLPYTTERLSSSAIQMTLNCHTEAGTTCHISEHQHVSLRSPALFPCLLLPRPGINHSTHIIGVQQGSARSVGELVGGTSS